jgi:CheY-like chemotaxis protein
MDLNMPGLGGRAALLEIRESKDPIKASVPILAFSASTRVEDDIDSKSETDGFTDFVGKPYRSEDLFRKISLHMKK